jgi:signal transduction histidine kinase
MLEAMRDLAAGAAHELNTPLAIVSGRAQLMRNRDASKKRQQAWQTIVDQAQRISDIIAELMEIASPPEPAPSAIAPQELLSAAAEAFSSSDHPQAKAARVDIQIGDDCPAIWADRAQMQAVVVELMTNAATAASAAPHIRLAAQADPIGGSVLLTVRDDGPGMDEDTAARAFTPFFSAQAAGRRRGLGLPRAKRYIEMNRGRIRIDSQPGEGTDVSILLPPARRAGRGNQTDAQR